MATAKTGPLDRSFYLAMLLLVTAVVVYGFSRTIDQNLIHPPYPRPSILYVHAATFTAWLILLIVQSSLVRTHNVAIHRKLGLWVLALGVSLPLIGVATSIVMTGIETQHGDADAATFMVIPFFDMIAFAALFGPAFVLRRQPEYHRRLMFMATCVLADAGFGRFPHEIVPDGWSYGAVDMVILMGVVRDLVVLRRIHPAYLYGLPPLVLGEILTMYVYAMPQWAQLAGTFFR